MVCATELEWCAWAQDILNRNQNQ
ncbi:hypothetical protein [Latilactobacillus curvatus]|nr:hypothetical protein [Latilactobacillus curvatus]